MGTFCGLLPFARHLRVYLSYTYHTNMGKPPNPEPPLKVTMRLNPRIGLLLDDLVQTGLFGQTHAEAAKLLVSQGLESKIKDGLIQPLPGGSTRLPSSKTGSKK